MALISGYRDFDEVELVSNCCGAPIEEMAVTTEISKCNDCGEGCLAVEREEL